MSENTRTCACTTQQYGKVIFNNIGYQNSANSVYVAKKASVIASINGTLGQNGTSPSNGHAMFKSDYERMQYLLGRRGYNPNGGAGCGGVAPKVFALGTN